MTGFASGKVDISYSEKEHNHFKEFFSFLFFFLPLDHGCVFPTALEVEKGAQRFERRSYRGEFMFMIKEGTCN